MRPYSTSFLPLPTPAAAPLPTHALAPHLAPLSSSRPFPRPRTAAASAASAASRLPVVAATRTTTPPSAVLETAPSQDPVRLGAGELPGAPPAPAPGSVREVAGTQDFLDVLDDGRETLVVVKFYSRGCRACKAIARRVERAADRYPDFRFYQVEYDANPEMCWRVGVVRLPHIQCYLGMDGRVEDFDIGPSTADKLDVVLAKYHNRRCAQPVA